MIKLFQKDFLENRLSTVILYSVLYFMIFYVSEDTSQHPALNLYSLLFFSILIISRIILIQIGNSELSIRLSYINIILGAVFWGFIFIGEVHFYDGDEKSVLYIMPILISGLASSAAFSLYKRFTLTILFLGILLLPSSLALFLTGDKLQITLGLFFFMYFLFMLIFTRSNYRVWKQLEHEKQISEQNIDRLNHNKLELINKNKELDSAVDIAKEASKSKSQFLANMSHEIRTPMNGIIGACDLLQASEMSHEQYNILNIISNSGDNLLNLINDILDFSKIEAGKLDIDNYAFNLLDTIESVTDQFKVKASEKNLELITYIEPNVPKNVIGDGKRITQILINLIGNSIKFTKTGQVFININSKTIDSDDKKIKVSFSIEDTGIGISPEKINKIFESFTQEDGSTSRHYGGTGLGTTISKMLVELMHGHIDAISPNPRNEINNDPGSIFSFEIELQIDQNVVENRAVHHPNLENIRCLIIDDNHTNLFVLQEIVSRWGIEVKTADNGKDGIELFKTYQPQLLLLDYHMPNLDGLQTIQLINEEEHTFKYNSILLSSDSYISEKQIQKNYNIDKCLLKPIKQSILFEAILKSLNIQSNISKTVKKVVRKVEDGDKYKILLVEDNLINQKVAFNIFKNMGFTIDIAENGRIALDILMEKTYDIIFMDYQMPELNGIETTIALREWKIDTTIIAMTANAMKGDKERCLEAGMNDYLSKPVKMIDLQGIIDKYLLKI